MDDLPQYTDRIVEGKTDIVTEERLIDATQHVLPVKKNYSI